MEISLVIDIPVIGGLYLNVSTYRWPEFTLRNKKDIQYDNRLMESIMDYDETLTKYEELIPDLKRARGNVERARNEIL